MESQLGTTNSSLPQMQIYQICYWSEEGKMEGVRGSALSIAMAEKESPVSS